MTLSHAGSTSIIHLTPLTTTHNGMHPRPLPSTLRKSFFVCVWTLSDVLPVSVLRKPGEDVVALKPDGAKMRCATLACSISLC